MNESTQLLFSFGNFLACMGIVAISICRLNAMGGRHVLSRVVIEYVALLAGALACAVQPWWGEYPQYGTTAFSVAVFIGLICSSRVWRNDDPPESATVPAPLGEK